jgi:hypothetical protein
MNLMLRDATAFMAISLNDDMDSIWPRCEYPNNNPETFFARAKYRFLQLLLSDPGQSSGI